MATRLPITYRPFNSGGKGGQHSNKTLNAMECTVTLPDGRQIKAQATESRSQYRNRRQAESILRARVRDALQPAHDRPDTSERVRTYHQPRNEVIDHVSGQRCSWDEAMSGGLGDLIEARREALALQEALRRPRGSQS